MDLIKKQILDELVEAAEEFLENCPGCSGLVSDPLQFDFLVDPSGDEPILEPAGCVCERLRKAVKEYQAYDSVSP